MFQCLNTENCYLKSSTKQPLRLWILVGINWRVYSSYFIIIFFNTKYQLTKEPILVNCCLVDFLC